MRILLATAILVMSTPAFAQEAPSAATQKAEALAEKLNDPVMQAALAGGMEAMVQSVLDLRVDGIAKAIEPLTGKSSKMQGKTVRDLASRDDPNFDARTQNGSKRAVAGAGAMASGLAEAMPELETAMRKMSDAMARVRDRMPDTQ